MRKGWTPTNRGGRSRRGEASQPDPGLRTRWPLQVHLEGQKQASVMRLERSQTPAGEGRVWELF